MSEVADVTVVEQLSERIRELEQRVAALEADREPLHRPVAVALPPLERPKAPATWRGFPPAERPAGTVPVLGKAVLVFAGAYLFRALAESGTVPKAIVLIAAILYAAWWMVWAARRAVIHSFAGITYAITSAMILGPLVWESTVRFQVLSPTVAAMVLAAFFILSVAVSFRSKIEVIPWIAVLTVVLTALALMMETRAFAPLTACLLIAGATTELAACLGREFSVRAMPAIASDLAMAMVVLFIATPQGLGQGLQFGSTAGVTALCLAPLLIYGASIGLRTLGQLRRITVFEIVQGVIAFVLSAMGVLAATHGSAAPALGVFFLVLAAVCYWGTLSRFAQETYTRDRRVFANWSAALTIAGSFLVLPPALAIALLCILSIAAAFVYSRSGKFSLGLHASFYLAAAAVISPLPAHVSRALGGSVPGTPSLGVWIVALSAALCYGIGARTPEAKRSRRALWIVPALLLGFTIAGLCVTVIVLLATGRIDLGPSRLSVVRTIVNCGLAITLGYLGFRQKRIELGWVAYAAVGFGALKLLYEDLRFGNNASLVVSFVFYGAVLILLPRLTRRRGEQETENTSPELEQSVAAESDK
jgi:hypothetical protein